MLPIIDGLEICRRLRADPVTRSVLVLMLTAKGEETDQVAGFSVGTDDYVSKPFSVKVLLERVRALLRRREGAGANLNVLVSQGIMMDRERHRVTVDDDLLDLTPSEFGLLEALIRQPGRVFSRSELIDAALGGDSLVLERTIDVHIRSLRKKLDRARSWSRRSAAWAIGSAIRSVRWNSSRKKRPRFRKRRSQKLLSQRWV